MFFSFQELVKLANLKRTITIEKVVEALNNIGFEVENYHQFCDVEGLKFGKIEKIWSNPQNAKLNVCQIKFVDKTRIIQTNAPNVFENMNIIAFVPGSRIGKTVFASKEISKIVSEGMLTNPAEFGIDENLFRQELVAGIAHYPEINDLNLDPIAYFGLNDYIIEIDILSNRSDAASYYVMARELAAYFETDFALPNLVPGKMETNIKVTDHKLGHLVMLETKKDFQISITEQIFLAKHQIKSINDGADLSNLTLLYSGQPTHAYDAKMVGNNFSLTAYSGDVEILGQKKVTLNNVLTVTSDQKPVAIASVIGLENTSAQNNDHNLIIELGIFDSEAVRHGAKSVKLTTLASSQGGKKLANGTTKLALRYLSTKLKTYSTFINWKTEAEKTIDFSNQQLFALVGQNWSQDPNYLKAWNSLKILGFKQKTNNQITIPSYRHDIFNSQDVCEELLRFYGFDKLMPIKPSIIASPVQKIKSYKKTIAGQGYQEVRPYALVGKNENNLNPFAFKENITLKTFVSKNHEVIQNTQAISLLAIAEYHQRRNIKNFSFFSENVINNSYVTIALMSNTKSFTQMQENLLALNPYIQFKPFAHQHLHPGVSAQIILHNQMIGWIGKIHPQLNDLDVIIGEIKKDALVATKIQFKPYNESPLKYQDITFELKEKEYLAPYLLKYYDFDPQVIDQYFDQKNQTWKITVRIIKEEGEKNE